MTGYCSYLGESCHGYSNYLHGLRGELFSNVMLCDLILRCDIQHAKEFLQARKSSQLLLQSPASSLPALPRTTTITPLLPKNQKNNELQGQQGEQQR